MKVKGKTYTSVTRSRRIELSNTMRVTVSALPLGADTEIGKLFPDPSPPLVFAKNKAGLVLRGENGRAAKHYDEHDAGYILQCDINGRRRTLYFFHRAIRADPDVEFETLGDPDSAEFYDAFEDELREAGLTPSDVSLVVKTAGELGEVDGSIIEEAVENLS